MAHRSKLGERRARRQADTVAAEVTSARIGLGASEREVSRRAGVSTESVRRVEAGHPSTQFDTMCAVAEAVGVEIVVRPYRSRVRLRDSGQLRIAEIMRSVAHPAWDVRFEVPAGDHGEAIDVGCFGATEILAIEIDRLVAEFEGTHRRNAVKRSRLAERHQRPVRLVMVVEDTRRNREAIEPHLDLIRSVLPTGSREILSALRSGQPLGRDGLLWIRPARPPSRARPAAP